MNPQTSLNQSITAAWATTSTAPKKRTKRAIGLNSPSTGSPAPTGAPQPNVAGPSGIPLNGNDSASSLPPDQSNAIASSSSAPYPVATSTIKDDRPPTPVQTRRKRPRQDPETLAAKYAPPELKLSLLGGLQDQITQLMEIVVLPLLHPEIYQHTGVPRPRGVLLHGVPGGGKTQLVRCLAGVSQIYGSLYCSGVSLPAGTRSAIHQRLRAFYRFWHVWGVREDVT